MVSPTPAVARSGSVSPGAGSVVPVQRLRRLPLPVSQPPFDDEVGITPRPDRLRGVPVSAQGALALSVVTSSGSPPAPELPPTLRLGSDEPAADPVAGVAATNSALPDPRRWIAKLAQAALESIYGQRPVQQLSRWTTEAVFRKLARRAAGQPADPLVKPRVRSIHLCTVDPTVAEAAVVVQYGERVQAVAVRLKAVHRRWRCTAFDIVEPRRPVSR